MKHCQREVINFLLCKLALLPSLTGWHLLTEQGILASILPLQSCALAKRSQEELFLWRDGVCTAWLLKPVRPKALGTKQGKGDAPSCQEIVLHLQCQFLRSQVFWGWLQLQVSLLGNEGTVKAGKGAVRVQVCQNRCRVGLLLKQKPVCLEDNGNNLEVLDFSTNRWLFFLCST